MAYNGTQRREYGQYYLESLGQSSWTNLEDNRLDNSDGGKLEQTFRGKTELGLSEELQVVYYEW